jgi:hypothetical protein
MLVQKWIMVFMAISYHFIPPLARINNMTFAPLVGINSRGRTIVFAWALLKDQTSESSKWALETFLDVTERSHQLS